MILIAFCFALLVSLGCAEAEDYICGAPRGRSVTVVECSRLIDSGKLTGRDLSRAYFERGQAQLSPAGKDDDGLDADNALSDFNEAIKVDPNFYSPYLDRALI